MIGDAAENVRGKVITANYLIGGEVVYWAPGGIWTESLTEARLLTCEDEQTRLLHLAGQDVERLIVLDPYLMDARQGAAGPEPVSQRERIRAAGPTVPTQFNMTHPEG